MILIADSGSTKTDWRLVDTNNVISQFQTAGFNPFFQDSKEIAATIAESLVTQLIQGTADKINAVHFYGAGCSTTDKINVIKQALIENFKNAELHVGSDMLGAARALCGNDAGIACILGTGSNSCYYDGKNITENVPSYGYLFGDHGSGANIGKALIQAYFDGKLPDDLKKYFEAREGNTRETILENVYKKNFPNRFLASYSKFVFQHLQHPFMIGLVKNCFHNFFESQVEHYAKHAEVPVNAVGSVGFYYNTILRTVAEERGVRMGNILETPIAALTLYHTNHE